MPYDDPMIAALFARQPHRMIPDLDRIVTLVELLGRPDRTYPSIHVTGTNGKTTTALMITSLLKALGLTAGTYTSPHLQDVRERIRVAGELISPESLAEALEYLAPFVAEVDERSPEPVTFFEVLTGLAFVHFADAPVDVGVFEVGMGGRWDATNVVDGQVAVLTDIALDHPELGGTVDAVAREKVGIIKAGAAVISAVTSPGATAEVARAAAAAEASLAVADQDFAVTERVLAIGGQQLRLRGVTGEFGDVYLPLHGRHQAVNAACALAAVEAFLGFAGGLDPDVIREGFANVRSPGRLEVVRRTDAPPVVLDGAHNPAGARTLAAALREEFRHRHRVLVLGALGDKDVEAIIAELLPVIDHAVVTEPPSSRAAPAERLAKALRMEGASVETAPDVAAAIELATGVARPEDAVIVTGSLYTVGAARDALGLEPA